ncbi:MAG: hypothetical protein AAF826_10830 [Pseudomonadota bacterium]
MGISINIAKQLATVAPNFKDCENGLMLGRQKMHFREGWIPILQKHLRGLKRPNEKTDIFQEDGFCETYLNTIGFPPMESMDFSALENAGYIHDLGQPVPDELKSKFDLVYDGGTTEHIFDIACAFRNVDEMLRDGGFFLSCVGGDGWFGHGFYQIGPDIPWRYWVASLGYRMVGCWTFHRRHENSFEPVPDPTGKPRGGERDFDSSRFIFFVVQKQPRSGPPKPVIQSHYVTEKYIKNAEIDL